MILKGSRKREELRSGEANHERDHTDRVRQVVITSGARENPVRRASAQSGPVLLFSVLSASRQRLSLLRLRFRKGNYFGLIHLVHGVGEFRRVLLSGKAVEEVAEEDEGADEGDKCYGEKHSERASRGTLASMFLMLVLPQWEDLLIR